MKSLNIVAVAVWRHRIAPVFDTARHILVLSEFTDGSVTHVEQELTGVNYYEKVAVLTGLGVNELLCGAVSTEFRLLLEGAGITVRSFLAGDVVEVLNARRNGHLEDSCFAMPGCCRRQRHHNGRGCF